MSELNEALPWLQGHWQRLAELIASGRLPHALLLTGPAGIGKGLLARRYAAALLCDARGPSQLPCGECRSCRLLAGGGHPDYQELGPEEGKSAIRVDQVRELCGFVTLKSQYGGHRLALIEPADAMNVNAANSLLKTLEEPPADAVLVLVASRPARLPATIRSRCQQLSLAMPDAAAADAWLAQQGVEERALLLALAGGAPLQAAAYAEAGLVQAFDELLTVLQALRAGRGGAVAAAARFQQLPLPQFLQLLMQVCHRLGLLGAGAGCDTLGSARAQALRRLGEGVDLVELHGYYQQLLEARSRQDHPLNHQLVLEDLFARWTRMTRRQRARA